MCLSLSALKGAPHEEAKGKSHLAVAVQALVLGQLLSAPRLQFASLEVDEGRGDEHSPEHGGGHQSVTSRVGFQ